jgi:hypothetical protein
VNVALRLLMELLLVALEPLALALEWWVGLFVLLQEALWMLKSTLTPPKPCPWLLKAHQPCLVADLASLYHCSR